MKPASAPGPRRPPADPGTRPDVLRAIDKGARARLIGPMRRRAWIPLVAAGFALAVFLVFWSMLPSIAMVVLNSTAPHQLGDGEAFITRARMSDGPESAVIRLTLTPDEAWRLACQDGWRPRALFGDGQTVAGSLSIAVWTWSAHLDRRTTVRGLNARATPAMVNQVLVRNAPHNAPWTVSISNLRLGDQEPPTREHRRFNLVIGGQFDLKTPAMRLLVRRLEADLDLRLEASGEQVTPRWGVKILDLSTDPPIDSPQMRELISGKLGEILQQPGVLLPAWLPWDLPVQVQVAD